MHIVNVVIVVVHNVHWRSVHGYTMGFSVDLEGYGT